MGTPHRVTAVLLVVGLGLSGCGDQVPAPEPGASAGELAVAVASFDIAVGDDRRLLAGVFTHERELLAFGDVEFALGHLDPDAGGEVELTWHARAEWLPVPGMEPESDESEPRFLAGETGSGVYRARVDLDRPGTWVLQVRAELADGSTAEGRALFQVLEQPLVPAVGDPAPRTVNLTIDDVRAGHAPAHAVDSRAGSADGEIPDPDLHDTVIPEAIDARRPVVVAVTTPVYCVSRFCGPLTEVVAELADEYGDVAEFVHVEVWHDFEAQQLTDAAAAWIQTDVGGNEPWVFLVGPDGRVAERWDNVLDVDELRSRLEAL